MTRSIAFVALLALAAVCLGPIFAVAKPQGSPGKDRVFEMRTYYTLEGRLPALNKRFREHTCELFKKHGIENIGYWTPVNEKDGKNEKLVYLLAYPSLEAREASWKAFQADPEWKKAQAESEKDGKIVKKVESVYLNPTDYSSIK
jgi:NIPSNAP